MRPALDCERKNIFHKDNASAHEGALEMEKFKNLKYEYLERTHYSPDLGPLRSSMTTSKQIFGGNWFWIELRGFADLPQLLAKRWPSALK